MTNFPTTISNELQTIIDFLRFGLSKANLAKLHYGHGTDNAWDDIYMLVLESLNLPLEVDSILLHSRLTQEEKQILNQQLKRRIEEKIPVPYLINKAYFCDLTFFVDERVLIPRSPLAELIKHEFTPWLKPHQVKHILDLGTGSGCIAIACAYAFPEAIIDASDISPQALAVAAINRQTHGLESQINLINSNCWDNIKPAQYDLIITNPPYVSPQEMTTLPAEYMHEPLIALKTEHNGLAIIEKIISKAHDYLTDDGILIAEVGNSATALMKTYPKIDFTWLEFEHGGEGVFLLTKEQLKYYFAPGL